MLLLKSWPTDFRPHAACHLDRMTGGGNACESESRNSVTPSGAACKCCGRYRPVSSYPKGSNNTVPGEQMSDHGLAIVA